MRTRFHAAIQQYGADDFEIVELHEYPTREEACEAEIALIAALELTTVGYNASSGGDVPPNHTGKTRSVEHKAAIAEANRRRVPNLERMRQGRLKRDHEWRDKVSAQCRALAADPDIRARISASLRGRAPSHATRAKLSVAQLGVPKSKKHRENMAIAAKAAWVRRRALATAMANM